jgi:hypothetical protein
MPLDRGLKTLSDICPCGRCAVQFSRLDNNGLLWLFCGDCYWWYIGNSYW